MPVDEVLEQARAGLEQALPLACDGVEPVSAWPRAGGRCRGTGLPASHRPVGHGRVCRAIG